MNGFATRFFFFGQMSPFYVNVGQLLAENHVCHSKTSGLITCHILGLAFAFMDTNYIYERWVSSGTQEGKQFVLD